MNSTSPGCNTHSRYGASENSGKRSASGFSTSTCTEELKSVKYGTYLKLRRVAVSLDCRSHLTGIVEKLRLMRIEFVGVLRGIQADVFASNHLICMQRESHVGYTPRSNGRCFSTVTRFMERCCCSHLSQEVLLRILVKRRHRPRRPEPRIYSDIVFISFTKTAVIWDADVLL